MAPAKHCDFVGRCARRKLGSNTLGDPGALGGLSGQGDALGGAPATGLSMGREGFIELRQVGLQPLCALGNDLPGRS